MTMRASTTLWSLSTLVAVTLHAGGAFVAYSNFNAAEPDAEDGVPAIEISMVFEAPRLDPTDLPPGPEAEASAAAVAAVEQTVQAQDVALPKDVPTNSEDPDQIVTQQQVTEPVEKEQERAKVQTQASAEAAASEATAPPAIEAAPEAPRAVAPAQGPGQSAAHVVASWQRKLVTHLDRNKRYPSDGDRRTVEVVVGFTLDRLGHVVSVTVVKSSGHPKFDEAALSMLRRADPVPAPPALIADDGLSFTVPVVFRARS